MKRLIPKFLPFYLRLFLAVGVASGCVKARNDPTGQSIVKRASSNDGSKVDVEGLFESSLHVDHVRKHALSSRLAALKARYLALPASAKVDFLYPMTPRRFIDREHWDRVEVGESTPWEELPWHAYGTATIKDFKDAQKVAIDLSYRGLAEFLTADNLRRIHKESTRNHFFTGYEIRALKRDLQSGLITREVFEAKRKSVLSEKANVTGKDHAELRGTFRSISPDEDIVDVGDVRTPSGERFHSIGYLERNRRNPLFVVHDDGPAESASDLRKGRIEYVRSSEVAGVVESVLSAAKRRLPTAQESEFEAVVLYANLVHRLISIHPFRDGNGRTIKIFAEQVLRSTGLPFPSDPISTDAEMSLVEFVEAITDSMEAYVLGLELLARCPLTVGASAGRRCENALFAIKDDCSGNLRSCLTLACQNMQMRLIDASSEVRWDRRFACVLSR
jgi:hypothetical protein